ncbi:uncharacterized protein (TIGR03089 family) [Arthrobacter stackebrandtii]|uniref:Uncharacterized protein (TIGR03089 family) n=1 Tax=Arthrobacter stackebrandtii TaxID=272161 RepID=A0ABS4YS35_9MICC|nr:TIGR03089 family protein [Arthrobacter stackebrandtii]MBP2411607.1 uncharacterized protein (TIGR03089 family) [Arthrobacter stackebrandtii]PYG99279.1 TIGR03089 family protein [Arthrobacter stackebrandtii]
MSPLPHTPAALLDAFRTLNATSPRLSWYGAEGERVEFSGRVLDNWVAKTANYLVDELDAEPGQVVALDLPLHWRSMVWLLAGWAVGATVATGEVAGGAEIVATTDPAAAHVRLAGASPAPLVVAVALPALAMRWMGELPPRTLDYCGDVRSHGDQFFPDAEPGGSDAAWRNGDGGAVAETNYAQLLPAAEPAEAPRRVLLQARDGWGAVVPQALKAWAAGGSVVLLGDGVEATDALRSSENVTEG